MIATQLSIYTSPPSWWRIRHPEDQKAAGAPWWKRNAFWRTIRCLKPSSWNGIGGHYAVTRSLLAGLDQNGVKYSYNPLFPADTVLVLSDIEALKFAIGQKRKGRIKFLAAGPNICILPSLCDYLVADEAIDMFIQPSEWIKKIYIQDCPAMADRLTTWPAGVDHFFWTPVVKEKPFRALIYSKYDNGPLVEIKELLQRMRVDYRVLVYGAYSLEEYKTELDNSSFLIHLREQESQGISLAEAWAMDVPTFVWNPGIADVGGVQMTGCCSAPYLSEATGRFWLHIEELERAVSELRENPTMYAPREWLLQNMTDSISALALIDLLAQGILREPLHSLAFFEDR